MAADSEETSSTRILPDGNVDDPGLTIDPRQSVLNRQNSAAGAETVTPLPLGASLGVIWAIDKENGDKTRIRTASNAPGYRLDRVVGSGGMGEVWEATQESLGRKVAIKKIRTTKPISGSTSARSAFLTRSFQHEALITACLDHPNIVPVYDIGRDTNGEPLLAMKLVRGIPWEDLLEADRFLDYNEQLAKHLPILIDVAQAVAFAHSRGVLHRDVKPSQVMVGEFGEVLLLDWGIACYFSTGDHSETEELFSNAAGNGPVPLMQAMNPAGTPAFMAPEQTKPTPDQLGPWTDVFLLGGTLYFILTGHSPYGSSRNAEEAAQRARDCQWKPLDSFANEKRRIPPELSRVCARAMAANPWERHESVNEFISEVRAFMVGFGKRRESIELTNKALELINEAGTSYAQLGECKRLIVTAGAIWDENPQVDELEALVHERLARAALENGDLILAREEAGKLPEGRRRSGLMEQVEVRIKRRRSLPRERRLYGILTVVLLIVSIGCLLIALDVWRKANGYAFTLRSPIASQQVTVQNGSVWNLGVL